MHSMTIYPELMRLKKKVVIGSYSFGDPNLIGNAPLVYGENGTGQIVRQVTANSTPDAHYAPEVYVRICYYSIM